MIPGSLAIITTSFSARERGQAIGRSIRSSSNLCKNVEAIKMTIKLAFVDTFQVIMYICTGLAWLSILMAALLIKGKITPNE